MLQLFQEDCCKTMLLNDFGCRQVALIDMAQKVILNSVLVQTPYMVYMSVILAGPYVSLLA